MHNRSTPDYDVGQITTTVRDILTDIGEYGLTAIPCTVVGQPLDALSEAENVQYTVKAYQLEGSRLAKIIVTLKSDMFRDSPEFVAVSNHKFPFSPLSDELQPAGFELVNPDTCGYAVFGDCLAVSDTEFLLEFSYDETAIIQTAVREHPETPGVIAESFTGPVLKGDHGTLKATVAALKWYEHRAPLGKDKLAYDARTRLNHAETAVRKAFETAETRDEILQ